NPESYLAPTSICKPSTSSSKVAFSLDKASRYETASSFSLSEEANWSFCIAASALR
ncbi:hypothetical protein A2U01_0104491, partial [Trifolium medium]|nr:hypothetical protein [Trifolium medium]